MLHHDGAYLVWSKTNPLKYGISFRPSDNFSDVPVMKTGRETLRPGLFEKSPPTSMQTHSLARSSAPNSRRFSRYSTSFDLSSSTLMSLLGSMLRMPVPTWPSDGKRASGDRCVCTNPRQGAREHRIKNATKFRII